MLDISTISNLSVAIFAGVALFLAWQQIKISREMSALSAYENYHILCLQYQNFAGGRFDFEKCTADERDAYTVFVLYTLMTGERIFTLYPNDTGWRHAVKDDVSLHYKFISSPYFEEYRANQQDLMKELIDEAIRECESKQYGFKTPSM
jgi:hypothetical protein